MAEFFNKIFAEEGTITYGSEKAYPKQKRRRSGIYDKRMEKSCLSPLLSVD